LQIGCNRIRNARIERVGRGEAGENALATIREAAEEQRSRTEHEDDEITRRGFVEVKPQCEQSRRSNFSWEMHVSKRRAREDGFGV
jgi:hypothetical protein